MFDRLSTSQIKKHENDLKILRHFQFEQREPSEQAETFVSDLRVDMDKIRNSSDWKRLEHTVHHDTVVQKVTFVLVTINLEVNLARNFITNLFPDSHCLSPFDTKELNSFKTGSPAPLPS